MRAAGCANQLDAWGLVNSVLCDVVQSLLVTATPAANRSSYPAASADYTSTSWVDIPPLSTSPCRENVTRVLALLDELTAGVLLSPERGGVPSLPSRAAVEWADSTSTAGTVTNELPFCSEACSHSKCYVDCSAICAQLILSLMFWL